MKLQNLLLAFVVLISSSGAQPTSLVNSSNDTSHSRTKRLSGAVRDPNKLYLADYIVSLRSRRPSWYYGDNHYCVGTIVTLYYVLTSAHCAMDRRKVQHRPRTMLVVAATPNRLKYKAGETWQVPVKKVWVPINFTIENTNDIAVLKTSEKMPTARAGIEAAKLPTGPPPYGKTCTVVGWGRIFDGGPLVSMITNIDVEIIPRETCAPLLKIFKEEMFCAGVLNNNTDKNPCTGDAGAPIFCDHNTLVGIVSYKIGCGTTTLPSIFTDIHYELDWINSILNGAQCKHIVYFLLWHLLFILMLV